MTLGPVPAELRGRNQWLVWRFEARDGKLTKVPYCAVDPSRRASSTDSSTWAAFEAAAAVLAAGAVDGVGFVFTADDPYCGVDLDGCLGADGLHADAAAIVAALSSYSEVSPSGTGVKTFLRANLNGFERNRTGRTGWGGAFEVYDHGRFFTVTGEVLLGFPATIEQRQQRLEEVLAELFAAADAPATPAGPLQPVALDDRELLERAFAAANGSDFRRLYGGDWSGYSSRSEADLAFCNAAAFWTGRDPARIDVWMRSSGLYRDKWRRDDYRVRTIAKAIAATHDVYAPPAPTSTAGSPMTAEATASKLEPDELASLLDDTAAFVGRFVVMSDEQRDASALWTAHTHALEAADATPYVHVTSAEKSSGKTRLLEVFELLVARPRKAGGTSAAALARTVAQEPTATVLLDETDHAFRRDREYVAALTGILNDGYRRGGTILICLPPRWEPCLLPVFGPKALAGIGQLPDTVASRSIRLELKRKIRSEHAERFRRRLVEPEGHALRDRLAACLEAHSDLLRDLRPELPDELADRAQDVWEPLLAIADAAGGSWPGRARRAAIALSGSVELDDESIGVRLLADVRSIFEKRGADRLASSALLDGLHADAEAPWASYGHGQKPLTAAQLGRLLRPFDIRSRTLRLDDGTTTAKGYLRASFEEAWERYATPATPPEASQRHNPHDDTANRLFEPAQRDGRLEGANPHEDRVVTALPLGEGSKGHRCENKTSPSGERPNFDGLAEQPPDAVAAATARPFPTSSEDTVWCSICGPAKSYIVRMGIVYPACGHRLVDAKAKP
jgi:hypothetical protein